MTKFLLTLILIAVPSMSFAVPTEYPAAPETLSSMMMLSEEWQSFSQQKLSEELDAVLAAKTSYMETRIFDLYTMLAMEEDHARNSNLSRFACQALITNISAFKDKLNQEMGAYQVFYRKQSDPAVKAQLDQYGLLLEKTNRTIKQLEAETKKNYVHLEV